MIRRTLALVLVLAATTACWRHRPAATPQRLSELRWRVCDPQYATRVVNGAREAIRVHVGAGATGSPRPPAPLWATTIQPGQEDEVENLGTIAPTARFLWVTAVERTTEMNGELRRPVGYERIAISCVARQ